MKGNPFLKNVILYDNDNYMGWELRSQYKSVIFYDNSLVEYIFQSKNYNNF